MKAAVRFMFAALTVSVLPLFALIAWSQGEPRAWRWVWDEVVMST